MSIQKHLNNNTKNKAPKYATCKCGSVVFESPKGEFRCSNCGNIKYNKEGS